MPGQPQEAAIYGALMGKVPARPPIDIRPMLPDIVLSVVVPSAVFVLLFSVLSLTEHPSASWICWLAALSGLLLTAAGVWYMRHSVLNIQEQLFAGELPAWRDLWPVLLCLTAASAWVLACFS